MRSHYDIHFIQSIVIPISIDIQFCKLMQDFDQQQESYRNDQLTYIFYAIHNEVSVNCEIN